MGLFVLGDLSPARGPSSGLGEWDRMSQLASSVEPDAR